MINGLQGEVLMATPLGLSTYNGIWSTQHINLNNVSEGLMNNYVTALEYRRLPVISGSVRERGSESITGTFSR